MICLQTLRRIEVTPRFLKHDGEGLIINQGGGIQGCHVWRCSRAWKRGNNPSDQRDTVAIGFSGIAARSDLAPATIDNALARESLASDYEQRRPSDLARW